MPTRTANPWPDAHAAIALGRSLKGAEVTADGVIGHLRQFGFHATKTALASAHRAGLISRPRVARLGRGKGTVSCYPADTIGRYACYQAALQGNRNKADAGWRLWCLSADVPEIYWRPRLEQAARQIDFSRSLALSIADRQDGSDRASDYAARRLDRLARMLFDAAGGPSMFRKVRKDLGPDRLRQMTGHVVTILAGRFQGFTSQPEADDPDRIQENRLMDAVFATGTARTDHPPGAEPWLSGDVAPVLAKLSRGIGRGSAARLLSNSLDGELATARAEFVEVLSAAMAFAEAARITYGDSALGMRRVRELVGSLTPDLEATLLIFWLMVRSEFKDAAYQFVLNMKLAAATQNNSIDEAVTASTPRLLRKSIAYPAE